MSKRSFFSSEPIFFKCIYIITFIGACYVVYENLFLEEAERSGLILYVLTLFGFYFIRMGFLVRSRRKRAINPNEIDN
ncbi:MAG TPA: hypothetical protein DCS19_11790 [Flavobacterium sp.]|nr:hypothetical protein [Flavobacterium sp.]